MGRMIYLKDVVTLSLDAESCTGCGMCLVVCPHSVFSIEDGHARIQDRDACMECGACSRNCPAQALSVQAGVGCAAAVISAALGRTDSPCCCAVEPSGSACGTQGSGAAEKPMRTCC